MSQSDVNHELTERIENLVRETDSIPDPKVREHVVTLVRSVMELHAAALNRIVALARSGNNVLDAMAADEFVSAVLAMHDLHPHGLEVRLARATEKLRGELKAGEMDLQLEDVTPSRVRLRLLGGLPASRAAVRHWIESTVYEVAPEVEEIVIEGADQSGFVPLESLLASREAV